MLSPEHHECASYPMRVVTRMTGLQADTIRAWERRYHAISPRRTEGNTRMFSAADVRRLTLLREATEAGHAIGTIAAIADEALEALVDSAASADAARADSAAQPMVERYLAAISRFEARRAHELLRRASVMLTARDFVFQLALPILRGVGERWSHGALGVAQEHLVSSQLIGLLATLARLHPPDRGAKRIIVTTPAGHRHAFGALVGALLATIRGLDVVYLGADLPDDEIRWAVEAGHADVLLLALLMAPEAEDAARLRAFIGRLPARVQVWLGMPEELDFDHPRAARFTSFESLELALSDLAR